MTSAPELPIIQQTYDLIQWYIPRINKFPRDHKFALGDRMQERLYGILEELIRARYAQDKLIILEQLNTDLEVLRYQTRLCKDFRLLDVRRYEYVSGLLNAIGQALGGWIRHLRARRGDATP